MTGFDERGKPRIRGSADSFLIAQGGFRNMGLGGHPGDVTFSMPKTSAKQEVQANRERGLRNSRDAERNTEMVRGGLDRKANTVVGPSLRPTPSPDIIWLGQDVKWMLEYQQAASSVFQEWATDVHCRCDAEGHYQFGGLMWQAFRTLTGPDSEVLGYIGYDRDRADRLGFKWGTFVNLIDPDRLSNPYGASNGWNRLIGGRIVGVPTVNTIPDDAVNLQDGRETDEYGAMTGVHVAVRHPSEPGSDPLRWEYIPRVTDNGRPMAFHWFIKRRAGMQRALTSLAAVLSTIQMLSQFSSATLQQAVSHAYMATYLKTTMSAERATEHLAPAAKDGRSEWDIKADAYEEMNLNFGGKRIPVLGPNDEIKFESLPGAQMDFDPFRNAFLRELASSLNVSFEQLSLDFSRSSYSSTRSSILEAWRAVTFERTMFTNHVANLIYDAVIEEAFELGILKPPPGAPGFYEARGAYTRCTWTGPGMGWVDPLKEIQAAKGRMGSVVTTLSAEASAQGGVWTDNIIQRALEVEFAAQHNVIIDVGTDPQLLANNEAADGAEEAAANQAEETQNA
jgi:lambda family phage portal protein